MPSKGRSNPCENPMRRTHSKLSQYKNVYTCTPDLLEKLREYVPEFDWKDGTRLCGFCRGQAYRILRAREVVKEVLEDVLKGVERILAEDSSITSEQCADLSVIDQEQPCSSRHLENNGNSIEELLPSCPPADDVLQALDSANSALTTQDDIRSQQNLTEKKINFPMPAFPISSNSGLPGSPSTSVVSAISDVPTSVSVQSTYTTPETIKLDLYRILSNLGIPTPERNIQHKKKKLHELMNQAFNRLKAMFKNFAGEDLVENPLALNCTHCIRLFESVKSKLGRENGKKERYMMLTSLPPQITRKAIQEELDVSLYVAKVVSQLRTEEGPFSFPTWKPLGHALDENAGKNVLDFYLSDDSSRVSPNARDTILLANADGIKIRVPRRFMLTNLRDSYEEFKQACPDIKIGISKFAELRPKNCKWPGSSPAHNSCVCIIHENFKFLLEGLKNASFDGMEQQFEKSPKAVSYLNFLNDYRELVAYLICSPPTEDCYMGFCGNCPTDIHLQEIMEFSEGSNITYKAWVGNDLTTCTVENDIFSEKLANDFSKFLLHNFIYEQQKNFIKNLKVEDMDGGRSAVITVDFGENYSFVIQDAVQGFHWNNRQATIHPFVLYSKSFQASYGYKTYFVISNDLRHDASSFHAFRTRVIKKIKEDFPHIQRLDYVSDGAASQYKNKKNIGNLIFHEDDFKMSARWIFTATGHGKSTCDAMSAVVKRFVRLRSLTNKSTVTTAEQMYNVALQDLSSPTLEFIFVTSEDVEYWRESLQERYNLLLKVPSIRKCHFFSVGEDKTLISKRFAYSERSEVCNIIKPPIDEISPQLHATQNGNEVTTGQIVAVRSSRGYQIGMVVEIPHDGLYSVSMMKKTGRGGVALSWFDVPRLQEFTDSDILLKCQALHYIEESQTYRLNEDDLHAIRRDLSVH